MISNVSKAPLVPVPISPRVIPPLPERSVRASVLLAVLAASIVDKPPAAVIPILIVPSLAVAVLPPTSVVM